MYWKTLSGHVKVILKENQTKMFPEKSRNRHKNYFKINTYITDLVFVTFTVCCLCILHKTAEMVDAHKQRIIPVYYA